MNLDSMNLGSEKSYKMNSEEVLIHFSKSHLSHALVSLLICKLGIITFSP